MGHLLSGFMVGLMVTSSKRAYATHCVSKICCNQRACPCGRLLMIHASTGDTQTLKGRCGSVSVESLGPGACKVLFKPFEHLWLVWGLTLNVISPLLLSCWGFSFALGGGVAFFGGIEHSIVDDLCSFPRQTTQYHSNPSLYPIH